MSRPVRVHPVFFARLQAALVGFDNPVEAEVEFVGRHLDDVEDAFGRYWDRLPGPPTRPNERWVDGIFDSVPALFSVTGCLGSDGVIELRTIRLVIDPEPELPIGV